MRLLLRRGCKRAGHGRSASGVSATVVPELAEAAEGAGQRLQEPLAARIAYAVRAGELPAHLDKGLTTAVAAGVTRVLNRS
jgi:hypothetical protein